MTKTVRWVLLGCLLLPLARCYEVNVYWFSVRQDQLG